MPDWLDSAVYPTPLFVSFRFGNSIDPKRKHDDDERNEEADDGATDDGLTQMDIGI